MAKVLDCGLEVSEFKLQLHAYVPFWTNTLGLNSITAVLQRWLVYLAKIPIIYLLTNKGF